MIWAELYRRDADGGWSIDEKKANRVRIAFEMAAEGKNYTQIRTRIDAMEKEEGTGVIWTQERLHRLLANIVYVGDYYSHKTVCTTIGYQVRNKGIRDRIYIEEHHEAIVPHALFDRVQILVENHMLDTRRVLTREEQAFINDNSWREETV